MDIFDLFKPEIEDIPKMTNEQFISKTREILTKIDKEYSQCWHSRRVTREEYKQTDCDNCKGECLIKIGDKEINCVPNHEDGDCFVREFDSELFIEEIENIMFHDEKYPFYELLSCEIINEEH